MDPGIPKSPFRILQKHDLTALDVVARNIWKWGRRVKITIVGSKEKLQIKLIIKRDPCTWNRNIKSYPYNQCIGKSANQKSNQWRDQQIEQSTTWEIKYKMNEWMNEWINWRISKWRQQSKDQPIQKSTMRGSNQSINQGISKWRKQPIERSTNQGINNIANQSTNQRINQSRNQCL